MGTVHGSREGAGRGRVQRAITVHGDGKVQGGDRGRDPYARV